MGCSEAARAYPGGGRRKQDRHFKCDGDERGPAIERPAAHVYGIADCRAVILEKEARAPAQNSRAQNDQRKTRTVKSHSVGKSFDREWRERVDAAVSRTLGAMRGREKVLGSLVLSHQSVNRL